MAKDILNVVLQYWPLTLGIVLSLIGIKLVGVIIKKMLQKTKLEPMLYIFVARVIQILLFVIVLIMVLDKLGVRTGSFVAVLSVVGAAIAFALKESLGNVAGGLTIIATKPFKQGDYIDINGTKGIVQHIDLLLTNLKTYDNQEIFIPNGLVTTSVVTNYSSQELRRVDCIFGIGYGDSFAKGKEIILNVLEANPIILKVPEPFIGVNSNGTSSINVEVRAWCNTKDYWDVKYFLEENIKIAFDEGGISIPYPQMDVHIKRWKGTKNGK